jgi:thymidylate synthase (FAD)
MIGKRFDVLGDGFVRLVDVMGDDMDIVKAARISMALPNEEEKDYSGGEKLIRYLMRHRHTSPFEMVEFKFHIRTPMDVWRQWIRHRTANVNEYSTRYSEAIDSFESGGPWRSQSKNNKQGSAGEVDNQKSLTILETSVLAQVRKFYETCLTRGVAKEQARRILPLSTYTEAYWKIDLHNLFHFLSLRLDKHAQKEIRDFAEALAKFVKWRCPIAYQAFEDYRLNAITLSAYEIIILSQIAELIKDWGVIEGKLGTNREGYRN